jgi:hypothetical protein
MSDRFDYCWANTSTQVTGYVFISQLALDASGAVTRTPGFEWVLPVCGVAFATSVFYSAVLIVLNTVITLNEEKK